MSGLTTEQKIVLQRADEDGVIYLEDYQICPGLHFCRSWDYLAVCNDSPEISGCECNIVMNMKPPGAK